MGIKLLNLAVTVATAGTRVQVTSGAIYCTSLYVEAPSTNSGAVFVGNSTVSSTAFVTALSPGQGWTVSSDAKSSRPSDANGGPELNLNTVYVDAATSGAVAMVTYTQRIGNS